MYEVIIFISITITALILYKQQAVSKKYNKLKRSIQTKQEQAINEKEKQKQLKAKEKERKAEEARIKKIIDRAYKDASRAVSDRQSILFKTVYNELLIDYQKEEEEKQKLYKVASDD